jgi:hypothetical protein
VPEQVSDKTYVLRARRFWAWFLESELDVWEDAPKAREAREQIRKVHKNLSLEIELLANERRQLLITANGVRDALPIAQILEQEAPPLRLFELQVFRQSTFELKPVRFGEFVLRPDEVSFSLEPDGARQGIILFMDGFQRRDRDRALSFKAAGLRLLDMALGEITVAEEVGFIEFREAGELGLSLRFPLTELADRFPKNAALRAKFLETSDDDTLSTESTTKW